MIDGRLLVPAVSTWVAVVLTSVVLGAGADLVARHAASLAGAVVGSVLLALVLLAVAVLWRRWTPAGRLLALAAVFVCLGAIVAAAHSAALTADPLASWTRERATATVRGIVDTEPVQRTSRFAAVWQEPDRVDVRMSTATITSRGTTVAMETPMVIRLPVGVEVPPPGSEITVRGRLGAVPWTVGAAASLTVSPATDGSPLQLSTIADPGWVDAAAHSMRTGLRASLSSVAPDAGALVAGLAVGDESTQPEGLADAMRGSGLSHLTAVSGGNVAVILAVVLGIAAVLRLSLALRVVFALLSLGFFVVLVGPQPSVLRAAVMGGIVIIGMLTGGRRAGPSVLAAAVLLLSIAAPGIVSTWAFALSACAAAGIILISPAISAQLARRPFTRRWPPALRDASALTGAAQIATLPLLVAMGGAVGWVALPANLLAMPAVPPVTVMGLLAAAISPIAPGAAALVAQVAAWPAGWIAFVARGCSSLPLARLPLPEGWPGIAVLGLVAAIVALVFLLVRSLYPQGVPSVVRGAFTTAMLAMALLWVLAPPAGRSWPPAGWFVIACDVGQGDALLLRSGPSAAVVIDAGPDPDAVDRCLTDAGVAAVSAVVLTHFHADHVNGLAGVLRGREVAAAFVSPVRDPAPEADDVDRRLRAAGLVAIPISAGDERAVGDVRWRALWPRRVIASGSIPNNASVVLAVTVAGHQVLLSGDVEEEAQAAIGPDLSGWAFDVVKVPHHGSRYQSPLLTTWAPAAVAIVSVGLENSYGHPAPETLDDWARHGALVARTDRDGDIAVIGVDAGVAVAVRHGMLPSS